MDSVARGRSGTVTSTSRDKNDSSSIECETFRFDKKTKKAMKPSVKGTFQMTWCWPSSDSLHSLSVGTDSAGCKRAMGIATVTELRGDPRVCRGERSVALVLSCGRRFLLPLVPEQRRNAVVNDTRMYWSVPDRHQEPHSPPPQFAELVVGRVKELEHVSTCIRRLACMSEHQGDEEMGKASGEMCCDVDTYFFKTLPFRTLWLRQVPNRLIVSLPCEERVITVSTSRTDEYTFIMPGLKARCLQCVGAFNFPPYTVPLDVSEVNDRPLLAVGTFCHGVIVLLLGEDGVCGGILHRVLLTGIGSSVFPVTRISTVFPSQTEPRSDGDRSNSLREKSALVSHCLDGAILGSSPLDSCTVAIRCVATGSDGCGYEAPPPLRSIGSLTCSSQCIHTSIGTIVATMDGMLHSFNVGDMPYLAEASCGTMMGCRTVSGRYSGAIDAVWPGIAYHNLIRRPNITLAHFICEGGAIIQKTHQSEYHTKYLRHWLCIGNFSREIVLLDRTLAGYVKHSVVTLKHPEPLDETTTTIDDTGATVNISKAIGEGKTGECNHERTSITDGGNYPPSLESSIVGLSWITVGDGILEVLVVHHLNWFSIVSWGT